MPGFPDCPGPCEFRDAPEVCHALASGVKRYCELIHSEGRNDYRELIRARTLGRDPVVVEVEERPPHRSGKPWVEKGVNQRTDKG